MEPPIAESLFVELRAQQEALLIVKCCIVIYKFIARECMCHKVRNQHDTLISLLGNTCCHSQQSCGA